MSTIEIQERRFSNISLSIAYTWIPDSPNGKYDLQIFKIPFQLLADQEAEMEANLEKMLKNEDETEDKATKSSGKDNSTPPKENVQNHNWSILDYMSKASDNVTRSCDKVMR